MESRVSQGPKFQIMEQARVRFPPKHLSTNSERRVVGSLASTYGDLARPPNRRVDRRIPVDSDINKKEAAFRRPRPFKGLKTRQTSAARRSFFDRRKPT